MADSFVRDLLRGQLQSSVVCSKCSTRSTTCAPLVLACSSPLSCTCAACALAQQQLQGRHGCSCCTSAWLGCKHACARGLGRRKQMHLWGLCRAWHCQATGCEGCSAGSLPCGAGQG